MKINNIYTAVACNRTPKSADWGKNGLIVYGACKSVVIFDPQYNNSSKVLHTFVKHTARVNCVKWIQNPTAQGNEYQFLTGSDDKLCLLWNISDVDNPKVEKLEGHTGSVTVVNGIYSNKNNTDGELIIVTSSADSTIKFWSKTSSTVAEITETTENNWICSQTIPLGNGFCFAISLCFLPTTNTLLAAFGTDDIKIHLYSNAKHTNKQDKISSSSAIRQFESVEILYGHEDWIRDLDFIEINDTNELLLASSSQDTFIRLWKISLCSSAAATTTTTSPSKLLNFENHLGGDYQLEEKIFLIDNYGNDEIDQKPLRFSCKLESVLFGHDGWVYGVHWNKMDNGDLQLLSSSIDKTLIIWQLNDDDVWMEKVRVGAVGGNTMGFYGGKFSANGKSIMGHGFLGSFHIWHQQPSPVNDELQQNENENDCLWSPGLNVGGHFSDVRDIGWEPDGQFLYSLSADQTTRIHAPWLRSENDEITWHEIARPQVHGYDMQCLSVLSRYRFASAAEEKIVRTFQAPGNFVENLQRFCQLTGNNYDDRLNPQGASVPSLGLSNKGVYSTESTEPATITTKHIKDMYPENYFVPIELHGPPSEETLMQNTLWPEIHKLYGHGYDLFALCSTDDGKLLASSCKAATAEHAQIILWNTVTWKQIQKLPSHQLTVTQMKFSPNGKYLLSVSRDRRWSIFEKSTVQPADGDSTTSKSIPKYQLKSTTTNKNSMHSRIIWTCDWTYDSKYFVTGSRDGKVIIWYDTENDCYENNVNKQETIKSSSSSSPSLNPFKSMPSILELKGESITAVAFSDYKYTITDANDFSYLIAIGLESGKIHLYKFNGNWLKLYTIENSFAHHLTVKKLQFRPNCERIQLASCGEDHFVRIYEIIL